MTEEGLCKTCKYWYQTVEDPIPQEGWATCHAWRGNELGRRFLGPPQESFSYENAVMHTHPDSGCELWEAKPEQAEQ